MHRIAANTCMLSGRCPSCRQGVPCGIVPHVPHAAADRTGSDDGLRADAAADRTEGVDAQAMASGGAADPSRWRLLALGLVALATDERFALHERIRDTFLAPRDITVPLLPWVAAGDLLLLVVGVIGLLVLPVLWQAMGDDRGARRSLLLGVGLAVVAVGMDSIDPSTWTTSAERVEQTAEEVIEYGSGLALLAAVALRLLSLLDGVVAAPRADRPVTTGKATPVAPTKAPANSAIGLAAAAPPSGTSTVIDPADEPGIDTPDGRAGAV